ncbi:Nitrile-specifier protein 5 [Phlyctema vagabunda]|uniref:Nitrile-specifier protein 5 n=1 Tax=Phlyctema vagabunda TaxID=108571 RepID=A0ABR4PMM8_9HELO
MMQAVAATTAAVKGMLKPTHPVKAKWERISAPSLPRSSHTLSVVAGRAYIFGGEVNPREPVDNDIHIITLSSGDYKKVPAVGTEVPEKRVGHTAAVIGERIFVFGGRGGKEMKPLQENGRVWIYNTRTDQWSFLDPLQGTPFPAARSYHSSVAIEKPDPPKTKPLKTNIATEQPAIGTIAESAKTDAEQGGHGTFFVHAGCPESGRTGDLWGFDVRSRTWKEFPTAPGKPRGGTAIAVSKSRIYRYGGFNGEGEEGGQIDVLTLGLETFNDKGGAGELGVCAKGGWETLNFEEESMIFPGKRSVAGLQNVTTGMGREYLVLLLGERDPSSQGHDGAGKFWSDVWVFQSPPQGMTGASLKDATWQALGRETGEGIWSQAAVADAEGKEGEDIHQLVPGERGWFACDSMGDLDVGGIVLWGGLNRKNEREDNGWILRVD